MLFYFSLRKFSKLTNQSMTKLKQKKETKKKRVKLKVYNASAAVEIDNVGPP